MNNYFYAREDYIEKVKNFYEEKPEPVISESFEISQKDFMNAGTASSHIKLVLKRLAIRPEILRRIAIASYEAEINVTAHSLGGKIYCNIFDEFVHIIFEDIGPGMENIDQAMVPGFSTADNLVREMGFGAGMGLPNIKKNSDSLKIESVKNEYSKVQIIIFFN